MPHLPGRALDELLARYLPQTDLATRDRLASLADGSIGRALTLSGSGGIPAASLVDRVLASLPHPKPGLADEVADGLGRGEDSFGTFMELLRAAIANAVRDAAAGRPDPDQAMLISARPLDAWVDIWQALGTLQSETEGLYLDKRQAIASTIGLLAVKA
jgi:DNA polymerase-3 subunit delta'